MIVEEGRSRDRTAVKVLLALSCLVIGGVVLYVATLASAYGVFWWAGRNGTVRPGADPVYAATDEQWLSRLESAKRNREELSAFAAASEGHILRIAPETRIRYKKKSLFDGRTLSPRSNDPSAQPVLLVTVLAGPDKGHTIWIAERDVGFYSYP